MLESDPSVFGLLLAVLATDGDAQRLFGFLVCNFMLVVAELLYGLSSLKIGFLTHALHVGFDCGILVLSLMAMVYATRQRTEIFSFGSERIEVLAAFSNAIFSVFAALFLCGEAIAHYFAPLEESLFVSLLQWLACFYSFEQRFGITFFKLYLLTATSDSITSRQLNVYGVWLHVVCDLTRHLGSLLATYLGSCHFDTLELITHMFTAILLLRWVWPLLNRTALILLQTMPAHLRESLEKCIREISAFDGVLECRREQWWSLTSSEHCGSIHIRIRADADDQAVLLHAQSILGRYLTHICVQIEKDTTVDWLQLH